MCNSLVKCIIMKKKCKLDIMKIVIIDQTISTIENF